MAFQRSYSKVWWGSDNRLGATSQQEEPLGQPQQQQQQFPRNGSGYHSLEYINYKWHSGNLSRIQEVDDEHNISKLSWGKRDSPGSLRSQDSGFSDNDESHSTRSLGCRSSPSTKSNRSTQSIGSPTSSTTSSTAAGSIATPPTVIRRVGKSQFYSPLVSVSRRISFTGSPAGGAKRSSEADADADADAETSIECADIMAQIDSMQLVNSSDEAQTSFQAQETDAMAPSAASPTAATASAVIGQKHRRRRRVTRTATKPLTPTRRRNIVDNGHEDDMDNDEDDNEDVSGFDKIESDERLNSTRLNDAVPEYNNETVYLGAPPPAYNNETVVLGGTMLEEAEDTNNNTLKFSGNLLSPLRSRQQYTASTSTPKNADCRADQVPKYLWQEEHEQENENPLLNGHPPALQSWLGGLRMSCEPEVMSTLQTKSIAQEAFKNLTITTNTVAKLIRQLQQRAMYMQSDFERIERVLSGSKAATLHEALCSAEQLVENVLEFTRVLERRSVFFTESRADRRRYEDNIEQIRIITKDTRYSLERQHYINVESLHDDIQVLKRYLLITIRLVFEKMVRVIVQSIEYGRSDLMLRANINMVATLMNIGYEGFASLTDAFVQNEAVRALLIVCLENRSSSVRAMALRALSTICSSAAAIAQLGACGGIEIVRDILQVSSKRGDVERREAVSLFTQITAAWHGPEHRVDGLKDCIETIVEGLTQLVAHTSCAQTLLLCAAALNNLSRIEITSHYSIMSNEAIFQLVEVVDSRPECVSIFLYEQIAAMLHNMSLNKKCHSHLANGSIINFITSTYEAELYRKYSSRAECDAQRRTIKAVLHTLTRLVQHSCLGVELLEQQRLPSFFKGNTSNGDQLALDSSHSRDISMLVRQLVLAQQQRTEAEVCAAAGTTDMPSGSTGLKFNPSRQESYV